MPMWLLKESTVILAPFLMELISISLKTGEFPAVWKQVTVIPHLKRPGLDQSDVFNYRPVLNLPFLSKLVERAVNKQLISFLSLHGLMLKDQSAYRCGHSTETAILKIFNDLIDTIANGRIALLGLIDLSSAYDSVDHGILIQRLTTSYGLRGEALHWIEKLSHW